MSWLEIVWECLQNGVLAYFVMHAYRNSQDVSELKAKMITMRGRQDKLEADYNLSKRNGFNNNQESGKRVG
ncbi:hypothetical protein [Nocardia phage P3.1]|nr:hypothetical protein [Nocardia phage P3.1]